VLLIFCDILGGHALAPFFPNSIDARARSLLMSLPAGQHSTKCPTREGGFACRVSTVAIDFRRSGSKRKFGGTKKVGRFLVPHSRDRDSIRHATITSLHVHGSPKMLLELWSRRSIAQDVGHLRLRAQLAKAQAAIRSPRLAGGAARHGECSAICPLRLR
jgi:hypothetical protein